MLYRDDILHEMSLKLTNIEELSHESNWILWIFEHTVANVVVFFHNHKMILMFFLIKKIANCLMIEQKFNQKYYTVSIV